MKRVNSFYFGIVLICCMVFFPGCLALLEVGAVEELGVAGIEVEELGTMRIVNSSLVADEMVGVRMASEGELSIVRNGRLEEFGELIDDSRILLRGGKVIKLPGVAYTVDESVFVRSSPFNSSSNIVGEQFSKGRLVIVNDNVNGFYEIMLPDHQFGFIPVNSASIARGKRGRNNYVQKHTGFRKGIKYIVNNAFLNTPGTKDMIVNITFSDGSFDETSSLKINSIASEKGYRSTPSFFSKNYYIDELGKELILGNLDYINKLNLYDHADYLLIGSYSEKIRVNKLKNDMLTCEFNYKLNLINLKSGAIESTMINTIYGSGWGETDTRNDALQAFYQIVQQTKF